MALTFIGYRGSGKSRVGAAIAQRLGRPFIDSDDEIERRENRTIADIFAVEGEPYFRRVEEQVMSDLLADDTLVIAAGGGAVLSHVTRDRLQASGCAVYLRVTPETAERRIVADRSTASRRPALTSLPGRAEIEVLMAQREPLYRECAAAVVDTDDRNIDELVDAVLDALPQLRRQEASS